MHIVSSKSFDFKPVHCGPIFQCFVLLSEHIFLVYFSLPGGRRVRGGRGRGRNRGVGNSTKVQVSVPTDGLDEEELSRAGVKMNTLKNLMKVSAQTEEAGDGRSSEDSPPMLISLDQITVREEDLTGKGKILVYRQNRCEVEEL